ncbi:GDSL-type esterase/lipase family protein [Telluribacter sp. SYSU D00476]|uniref:GDSL-type esterase/lipase family protein n=1 Tax=Telluribacter sp. SYSU D00476 TaxID=2811430 RepID=UPI001FF29ADD|nr:GDSL-type esterase/lipase family protein [Telluribacter sp. SYSU D00476]
MIHKKVPPTFGYIFLWLLTLPTLLAVAQTSSSSKTEPATFAPKHGERVLFVGNSLFENDLQHGYLELALTTRWPDRQITFRNIGWSGDNVFGAARGTITNPPTPYDVLMEQITKAQPTLVFVGYGGIEAEEGEEGLPRFTEGLNKLLDKIDQLGAKAVLLSPMPLFAADSPENLTRRNAAQRNAMLELYTSAIAKTASQRGNRFIDIYKPLREISQKVSVSDNGFHLNETGYYHLALVLEKGLGLAPRQETVTIQVSKQGVTPSGTARLIGAGTDNTDLKFTIDAPCLSLPLPAESKAVVDPERVLRITGLKKGYYTLTADGNQVYTASDKQWAEGVALTQVPLMTQAIQLREMIRKKNELYFHQYRPQNHTYIIGFRSYEQGRHVKTLEDLSFIITWLEGQIALRRMPKSPVYQLSQLK